MNDWIIIGEWWNADPEAVLQQALQTGAGPNVSDAYTFNGLPGPLYNCSQKGISQKGHQFVPFRPCNLLHWKRKW